jgi:hypothetical protein
MPNSGSHIIYATENGVNYKAPPLNPLKGTYSYFRILKYLYHDRTLQENCSEIENRRTNLKSPQGDLGVVEKDL